MTFEKELQQIQAALNASADSLSKNQLVTAVNILINVCKNQNAIIEDLIVLASTCKKSLNIIGETFNLQQSLNIEQHRRISWLERKEAESSTER